MNNEVVSDQELLEAIARKDANAFNYLYRKYNKSLLSKARFRIQDTELAEGIMQDFWIEVWIQPSKIKCNADGDAKGFLSNYLLFRVLDFYRKESMNVIALAKHETLDSVENKFSYTHVSEEYDIKELGSVIDSILKDLPDKMGEIFMMLHRDGYTIKETAKILNLNERTVKYKSKQAIAS